MHHGSAPQLGQIQYSAVRKTDHRKLDERDHGTFPALTLKDNGTTPIQSSDCQTGVRVLANPPLNETSVFHVAVAQLDGVAGPYGNPVQMMVGMPARATSKGPGGEAMGFGAGLGDGFVAEERTTPWLKPLGAGS
jgi:hypothetical protein